MNHQHYVRSPTWRGPLHVLCVPTPFDFCSASGVRVRNELLALQLPCPAQLARAARICNEQEHSTGTESRGACCGQARIDRPSKVVLPTKTRVLQWKQHDYARCTHHDACDKCLLSCTPRSGALPREKQPDAHKNR